MNNSPQAKRRYTIFAVVMVILLASPALLPLVAPNTTIQQAVVPTTAPQATFPAPPTDLSAITFDQTYLHPSALYVANYPQSWTPTRPSNNGTQVQVNFENTAAQSVIEVYLEVPAEPVQTLQQVSERYNENALRASWSRYTSWEETGREINAADNAVVIDFELTLRNQTYLARHYAELKDDGSIYVTRVVTPDNARSLLLDLLGKARTAIHPVDVFSDTPVAWNGYYSEQDNVVVRYPNSWVLRDGGAGQPVTIEGTGLGTLRIETATGSVADEDAASAFVLSLRPDAEIKTVQPIERVNAAGFEVSYTYRTLEGEPQSALTVILPDGEDTLRVATVRVANQNIDLLNTTVQTVSVTDSVEITRTFNLTTGLGLPVAAESSAG